MKRPALIVIALLLVIVAVGAFIVELNDPLRSAARKAWAAKAIHAVERRANDASWLGNESARLQAAAATRLSDGAWAGPEMLIAANGDWMVCQSVCAKDEAPAVRKDLFVGRGSDGKWYYSTFHFCKNKMVLSIESQPPDLAHLVRGYWLQPFDGSPANCLAETWTGGPYGEAKW
jgi:hypothetical protein